MRQYTVMSCTGRRHNTSKCDVSVLSSVQLVRLGSQ